MIIFVFGSWKTWGKSTCCSLMTLFCNVNSETLNNNVHSKRVISIPVDENFETCIAKKCKFISNWRKLIQILLYIHSVYIDNSNKRCFLYTTIVTLLRHYKAHLRLTKFRLNRSRRKSVGTNAFITQVPIMTHSHSRYMFLDQAR